MDFIDDRTRSIGQMALDGLYERAKAISSNTVNVLTPNYQRKEVSFEKSLQDIIKKENEKEDTKLQNSKLFASDINKALKGQTLEQFALNQGLGDLNKDDFIIDVQNDLSDANGTDGNNVDLEVEMMDEAKNGMQYQVVASLLSRSYSLMNNIISGQNR